MAGRLTELYRISQEAARRGGLSVGRQVLEMAFLKLTRQMGPGYYQLARFWRREIPFRDKWRQATVKEYERLVFRLNPDRYQKISQHKVVEKSVLSLFGFRTPKFIGYFHATRGRARNAATLRNAEDLHNVLLAQTGKRVCFKAVEGDGGKWFQALDVDSDARSLTHPLTKQRWTVQEWAQKLFEYPEGWVLEEYLQQHPDLAALNGASLNTLRLWVLERHGTIKVHHAFLKIGRADSQVDNIASGGVGCAVEVETGRVMTGFVVKRPHETFTHHPDTGLQLLGRQLPYWPEVLSISCDALSLFPNMRFAGLDVAIAADGPYVIELNVYPARRNAVFWDLPQKDFLEWALQPGRPD